PIGSDKYSRGRAAAESLNPKGSAAGKKIEHARTDDELPQARENGRLDAIHGRPDAAFRNVESNSTSRARDHPHGEGATLGATVADSSGDASGRAALLFLDFLPPRKPLTMSFKSRPTIRSTRFVFG